MCKAVVLYRSNCFVFVERKLTPQCLLFQFETYLPFSVVRSQFSKSWPMHCRYPSPPSFVIVGVLSSSALLFKPHYMGFKSNSDKQTIFLDYFETVEQWMIYEFSVKRMMFPTIILMYNGLKNFSFH